MIKLADSAAWAKVARSIPKCWLKWDMLFFFACFFYCIDKNEAIEFLNLSTPWIFKLARTFSLGFFQSNMNLFELLDSFTPISFSVQQNIGSYSQRLQTDFHATAMYEPGYEPPEAVSRSRLAKAIVFISVCLELTLTKTVWNVMSVVMHRHAEGSHCITSETFVCWIWGWALKWCF